MMGNRWILLLWAAVFVLACGVVQAQQDNSAESLMLSVEEEGRRSLLSERVGPWTVRELSLPDDFVGRIVDRAIQRSYRDRFHLVVRDDPNVKAVGEDDRPANTAATYEDIKRNKPVHWPVTVHLLDDSPDEASRLRRYGEGIPSIVGLPIGLSLRRCRPRAIRWWTLPICRPSIGRHAIWLHGVGA